MINQKPTSDKDQQESQSQVTHFTPALMLRCWPEGWRAPRLALDLSAVICSIVRQFDLNVSFSILRPLQGEPAVLLTFELEREAKTGGDKRENYEKCIPATAAARNNESPGT